MLRLSVLSVLLLAARLAGAQVDLLFGPLTDVQQQHPEAMIGSYPQWNDGHFSTQIVVRAKDDAVARAAVEDLRQMLSALDC